MAKQCQPRRSALWWATTPKGSTREAIAALGKRITKLQGEHGLPCYSATTFETRGGQHSHIVFIGNGKVAARLRSAPAFGDVDIAPLTDPALLARTYLAKERTPQAGYLREAVLGGRLKGSHRLPGGGDRVRLSRDLARAAIQAGYVEPWQHSNARRTDKRKGYRLRGTGPQARAPQLAGQLTLLLREIERPVSRLRDFGGGMVPRAVALEMELRRKRLKLSQRAFAAQIGISQGQYSNAVRGHDPISPFAVNRLRELPGPQG